MSQITSFFNGSGSGTVASVTGGVGINITGNPSLNPVVNLNIPVIIAHGGTNATSMTNTNGVNYFDGTRIVTTTVGTAGQVLTSQGIGLPPVFTSFAPGGVVSVSAGHDIFISGAPATPIVNVTNAIILGDLALITAGNDAITVQTGDITLQGTGVGSAANINLPDTSSADQGVITLDNAPFFHAYGSDANLFIGDNAGNFTMTVAVASDNVGLGTRALSSLTVGTDNTGIGIGSLLSCSSGRDNAGLGGNSLRLLSTGVENTGIGVNALTDLATGSSNVALGTATLGNITTSSFNTSLGWNSGLNLLTGAVNTFIGANAALSYTTSESHNVIIASGGTIGDNHTIRIGTQGVGSGEQNLCFIAGIVGVTTSNSQMVTIDSTTGQLGVATLPSSFAWSVITVNQSALSNHGYICNKAGLLTLTLPATSSVGDIIEVTGMNTDVGWHIAQNANQVIHFGIVDTTVGVVGYLESTLKYDAVRLVCNVANLEWIVMPGTQGNITVV